MPKLVETFGIWFLNQVETQRIEKCAKFSSNAWNKGSRPNLVETHGTAQVAK